MRSARTATRWRRRPRTSRPGTISARALTAVHRLEEALAVVSGGAAAEAGGCRYPRLDRERARNAGARRRVGRRTTGWRWHRIPIWPRRSSISRGSWRRRIASARAPDEAVRLAERAARLATEPNATILDTLAAAYFSAGQVARAAETAQAAVKAAIRAGNKELADRIAGRLRLYVQQSR